MVQLRLVGNPDADALLSSDPLALLIGMLLDQQIPMETAFAGPKKLAERLASFDAATMAAMDPEEFAALCAQPPAVHRFPGAMAKRIQALCQHLEDNYDGKADAIWTQGSPDGREILKRLKALPGYGDQKARIFLALLGKQLEIDATGWREAAGDYGQDGARRSIADVVDDQTLQEVRDFKRQMKAAKKK
ncbi:HhH-GPD-type base excision DNA repair protein [Hoyosella altamirensis]|uniref:Putative HhH-GPD family protein n=1 Tax=Hoyosella altamirensis TaxID=616997 RepID=A0A839RLK8_9ACTN|nr:HhH-GPD-type base excision DNA repair protein [Hoyosella altamirensis]MBB3037179.1 putative HhH-GPD family protein [Hoyosella altamirensis]